MSSWGSKLEKKLIALADGASKESLQTLANWVAFNRKHAAVFSKTFCDALLGTTTETRQWLYWQALNEILLANYQDNPEKWERASDLRTSLGEAGVIPALEGLGARALTDKLEGLLKQWDNHNVFGGPTLIGQIRRLLASSRGKEEITPPPSPTDDVPAAAEAAPEAEATTTTTIEVAAVLAETTAETISAAAVAIATKPAPVETSDETQPDEVQRVTEDKTEAPSSSVGSDKETIIRQSSISSLPANEIEYDFESKNVPLGVVDSREFLDPCTAVATLQIARDVRNDASVQLSSMLANLPSDMLEKAQSLERGEIKLEDLDATTIRDYSIRMPIELLNLDLDEQYQSIITLQDIIRKQRAAREKLIYLLLKSRCRFGSNEAAKQFMELEATSEKLKKRKRLLVDALELEGLDAELDTTDFEKPLKNLQPLSWYQAEQTEAATTSVKHRRVD